MTILGLPLVLTYSLPYPSVLSEACQFQQDALSPRSTFSQNLSSIGRGSGPTHSLPDLCLTDFLSFL